MIYDYDTVIIGSGIGGLTAGAYLARSGRRPMVCEQHHRPGGYFSSFDRKGYRFDAGTQSVEDVGLFTPMLSQIGLSEKIDLRKSRFAIASQDFFRTLEYVDDIAAYFEELIRLFPAERRGLQETSDLAIRFCTFSRDILGAAPNPFFQDLKGLFRKNLPAYWRNRSSMRCLGEFFRLLEVPLEEYLRDRISNPDVINMICNVGFYGMSVSFGLAFLYFMMDYYYPMGGFQAIADAMVGSIEEGGGKVQCDSMVEEIIVDGGRASGVKLQEDDRISAPFVISNADMRSTFLHLLPAGSVPAGYRSRLIESKAAHSMFTVYLGLDIPPGELENRGCHHIVIFPGPRGADLSRISEDPDFYQRSPVMVSMPTEHDPSLAPEGKSILVIQYYATEDFCDYWHTKERKSTPEYRELKEKVAGQMIAATEKVMPGLSGKIELKVTASPFTYRRYSLNSAGSTIGWSKHPRESFSPFMRSFLDFHTPVKNLYQVGHWAFGPGGIPGGAVNGKMAAELVRLRLNMSR